MVKKRIYFDISSFSGTLFGGLAMMAVGKILELPIIWEFLLEGLKFCFFIATAVLFAMWLNNKRRKDDRDAHAKELKDLREAHAKELKDDRDAHAKELKDLREAHAKELKDDRDAHAKEIMVILEVNREIREINAKELNVLRAEIRSLTEKSDKHERCILDIRPEYVLRYSGTEYGVI